MIKPFILQTRPRYGDERPTARYCIICGVNTREKKLYCIAHIEKAEYVQDLNKRIKAKEKEETRAFKIGARAVKVDSETSKDMICQLKLHGPNSTAYLARLVNLPLKTAEAYVKVFLRKKIMKTGISPRGGLILELV